MVETWLDTVSVIFIFPFSTSENANQSDFCFVLVRPEYYEVPGDDVNSTEAHIVIRKNIYGPLTTVVLETDMEKQLFKSVQIFQSI